MRKLLPAPGPLRPLALATLLSRVGNGLLMTISVLYFTRIAGLSIAEAGLGLTIAGFFGLLAGVPFGQLADRRGPRTLFVVLSLLQAVLVLLYLAIGTFWQFLAVATVVTVLDRGANAVRFALIAAVTEGSAARVAARAYLRSMTNIGVTAGAGIGAIALSFGTASWYRLMFGLYVVLSVTAALVVLAVARVAPRPRTGDGPVWIALRDRGYLAVAGLNAALSIHYSVIDIAVPLWVVDHTDAPHWAAALPLIVNAAFVAVLQVRAARGIVDTATAARASRTAGLLLLASMALFAAAAGDAVVAVVVLAVAALVQVGGELLQSSGSFLLGFDLAADHAQGQYQGVWNTSTSVSSMVAPTVLALLPLGLGTPGWLVLGAWFALTGALFVPVVRWAAARRPVGVATYASG